MFLKAHQWNNNSINNYDYKIITIRNYYNKTNQKLRMHIILKLNNNSKERKQLSIPLLSYYNSLQVCSTRATLAVADYVKLSDVINK